MTHPARVWMFLAASTLASGAISSLRPLYTTQLTQLGLGSSAVLTTTGALRMFSFLGAPLIGLLMDRLIGVRRGALGGAGAMVLACALALIPGQPVLAVVSLVLLTVGEAFVRVGLLVMIADAYAPASAGRASAFLLRHVGLNFSFIGLPVVTSVLFAGGGMWLPATVAIATSGCALGLLLLSPEQEDTAQNPVRTSAYGLLVFSLLGLATSAVNVVTDGFMTGRLSVTTQTESVAAGFIQLLNPFVVVALGIPVAIMWMRARGGPVGILTALLAAGAFVVCAVQSAVAVGAARTGLPPGGTLATVQMMGATVEVLAWPLSTALVSSVAPLRWRATWLGLWTAITGIPFGLSHGSKIGSGASPEAIAALGVLSLLCAAVIIAARARIARYVDTFGEAAEPLPAHSTAS